MARWVLHPENVSQLDGSELLNDLAEDVAADARRLAPERHGRLKESIHVAELSRDQVYVVADPERDQKDGVQTYAAYVELGTSDTPSEPFLKPALYRERS